MIFLLIILMHNLDDYYSLNKNNEDFLYLVHLNTNIFDIVSRERITQWQ